MRSRRLVHTVTLASTALLAALLMLLSGCGADTAPVSGGPGMDAAAPRVPVGELGGGDRLPGLLEQRAVGARQPSWTRVIFYDGFGIAASSDDTSTAGTYLTIPSTADRVGWATYALNTGGYQPESLSVSLAPDSGGAAYVGVSNYAEGYWELHGPYTGDAQLDFDGAGWLSPLGQFYVVVIAAGGTTVTVKSLLLEYDNALVADFSVAGTVLDEHGDPAPGIEVAASPGGDRAFTNAAGQYYLGLDSADTYTLTPGHLSGKWTFTPMSEMVAVDGAETGIDFAGLRRDLRGRIATSDGAGVGGVQLTLMPGGQVTHSAADGSYLIDGVSGGATTRSRRSSRASASTRPPRTSRSRPMTTWAAWTSPRPAARRPSASAARSSSPAWASKACSSR